MKTFADPFVNKLFTILNIFCFSLDLLWIESELNLNWSTIVVCRKSCKHCKCSVSQHIGHSSEYRQESVVKMPANTAHCFGPASNVNQPHNKLDSPFGHHQSVANGSRLKRRQSRRHVSRAELNSDNETNDRDSGCALEEYTWVPPNLTPDQVGLFLVYLLYFFSVISSHVLAIKNKLCILEFRLAIHLWFILFFRHILKTIEFSISFVYEYLIRKSNYTISNTIVILRIY